MLKGVWPYKCPCDVLLVMLIQNMYGLVGLAPFFFLAKCHFFVIFNTKRGDHIDMLIMFP